MKKYNIALAIVALAFLFGCCPPEPKPVNTTVYQGDPGQFRKESWNGHIYVIWQWGYHLSGITHDPDCPCHKEAKKEEHIYENPSQN